MFTPWSLQKCILDPAISQIRTLGNDDLETRAYPLGEAQKEFEQPAHSLQTCVLSALTPVCRKP